MKSWRIVCLTAFLLGLAACVGMTRDSGTRNVASNDLPQTAYRAEIDGSHTVWMNIPASAQDPVQRMNLGQVVTVKKGAVFYHWDSPEQIQLIVGGGLTEANMNGRILHAGKDDVEGGGLYLSSDASDSSRYGTQALAIELSQDVNMVNLGFIEANQIDYILALRGIGITAIQEGNRPSWFNFITGSSLAKARVLTAREAAASYVGRSRADALLGMFFIDQRMTVTQQDLPDGLDPIIKSLFAGQTLNVDDQKFVKLTALNGFTHLMLFFQEGLGTTKLKQTTFYKAFDAAFTAQAGQTLKSALYIQ